MEQGKSYRATTYVVMGMLALALVLAEGCGGYVAGGGGGANYITGTVVDASTSARSPVPGALVVLEQPDGTGTDRIIASTSTASNGSFSFAPPSTGVFDVVAVASVTPTSGSKVTYAATVTFGVLANANLNQIPLAPEFGSSSPIGDPVLLSGTVSSAGTNSVAFMGKVDVQLSALQSIPTPVGSVSQITIPAFAGSTTMVTTMTAMPGSSCPNNTTCASYSLLVPAGNFYFGTFSASGTSYTLSPQQLAYTVEGKAFIHMATVTNCTPSIASSQFTIQSGSPVPANASLVFTACL